MLRYLYKTLIIIFVVAALAVLAAQLADVLIPWLFDQADFESFNGPR